MRETKERILSYIESYQESHGYPPTYREIADALDISSTSVVTYHILVLERDGKITRKDGKARTIQVVRGAVDER